MIVFHFIQNNKKKKAKKNEIVIQCQPYTNEYTSLLIKVRTYLNVFKTDTFVLIVLYYFFIHSYSFSYYFLAKKNVFTFLGTQTFKKKTRYL